METAVSNGKLLTPSRNSLDDPVYERIKRGELDYLEHYSRELNSLLWLMVHPDPAARPTAAKLLANPLLNPTITKSRYRRESQLGLNQGSGSAFIFCGSWILLKFGSGSRVMLSILKEMFLKGLGEKHFLLKRS